MSVKKRYRRRPVDIVAVQFVGGNIKDLWDAFGSNGIHGSMEEHPDFVCVQTADGVKEVDVGDWVVETSVPGVFEVIQAEAFYNTYFEVSSAETAPAQLEVIEGGVVNKERAVIFATDANVIGYGGENYYRACDAFVSERPDGGQTFCVKRRGHPPGTMHEDYAGVQRQG